ncbi:nicotinate (nicotinamide) nucleotide adenylyltransferase [Terriglobus tenax]|uniref:nicotinate (nicotinamide) nucleotide adenylyltransferase n=1 Tax=Terriglobus tenax TaxID=1111115 RepID=UPI0021DF953F|nr:nicotinate (nicotinamide) nucleotide adenylyltransferase [Terriglobus tenax]
MQRIGIFGGTFDPPHIGHVAVACAAVDAFALDAVWWMPVGHQPLKSRPPSASYAQRLAMVQLTCEMDPRFSASNADAPRSDGQANYTVDLLQALAAEHPDCAWWNIVGADSFLDLLRWKQPERLLELAEWIVVSRPGFELSKIASMGLTPRQRERVHLLAEVDVPVSATALREALARGERPVAIPSRVLKFIEEQALYR